MNLSGVYRAARKVAGDVVRGAGQAGEYVAMGTATFDPATGEATAVEQAHPVRIVWREIDARLIDGSSIQAGDRWALVAASDLSVVPTTAGRLRVGTLDLAIVRVETVSPGGTGILYRLQVRR